MSATLGYDRDHVARSLATTQWSAIPAVRMAVGPVASPQPKPDRCDDEGRTLLTNCSCCGEPRDVETTATLQCHDDIRVCRACIGWLAQQAGMLDVTPALPVVDMNKAVGFYEAAGFVVRRYDEGFVFVHHDEQSVFDLALEENIDPQRNGAGCYIIVADVDAWHARFTNADLNATAVETKPWGMREFTTVDPSGNHIRIGTSN